MEYWKTWTLWKKLENLLWKLFQYQSITEHGVTVCDGKSYCLLWNVQHTNETLWGWKKFPLSLAFHTSKNCLWGKWFEEDIRVFILLKVMKALWKVCYGHFQIRRHFFQNNITSLISFRMLFFKTEKEVWIELKLYGCCWKNLKDYYSRKCTLNQSNEKFSNFFHNKQHEKCLNFKVYIWFFYRKRWLK